LGAGAAAGKAIDEVDITSLGAGVGAAVGANKNRNITSVLQRCGLGRVSRQGSLRQQNDIKAENVLGGAAAAAPVVGLSILGEPGKSSLLIRR